MDVLNKAVRIPPIAAMYVAPILPNSKAPKASRRACTRVNILSIGEGKKVLDKKITAPKIVAKATLFVLSSSSPASYNILFWRRLPFFRLRRHKLVVNPRNHGLYLSRRLRRLLLHARWFDQDKQADALMYQSLFSISLPSNIGTGPMKRCFVRFVLVVFRSGVLL